MTLSLTLTLTLTPTRPKRNIRTAMNHEIMLYGIAQKVRGGAVTNRAQPHPDLRSPLALAASQEQLGFDKAVEVRPEPPQTPHCPYPIFALHDAHPFSRFCLGRSASTVRLWPRQTTLPSPPPHWTRAPLLTVCRLVCPGMSRYAVTPNMLIMPPQVCPSATATQQRPCTRLTRMLCLPADAALHGARAGAECVATPLNAHAPPTTHGISRMRPLL